MLIMAIAAQNNSRVVTVPTARLRSKRQAMLMEQSGFVWTMPAPDLNRMTYT